MGFKQIFDVESEVMKIIEFIEEENLNKKEISPKEQEFYGDSYSDFDDEYDNQFRSQINTHRNLIDYLKTLSLVKLKTIQALILTGQKITEEDVDDEKLDNIKKIFNDFYQTTSDRKEIIVDYIIENNYELNRYLTNGLMYCSQ
jgi:hypothetical protein